MSPVWWLILTVQTLSTAAAPSCATNRSSPFSPATGQHVFWLWYAFIEHVQIKHRHWHWRIYDHISTYIHMQTSTPEYMYMYMYIFNVYYIYIYLFTHIHIHIHVHIHIYIYIHAYYEHACIYYIQRKFRIETPSYGWFFNIIKIIKSSWHVPEVGMRDLILDLQFLLPLCTRKLLSAKASLCKSDPCVRAISV